VRCSKCGAENPEGLKFCEQCAAPFKQRCPKCGFENSPAARFAGSVPLFQFISRSSLVSTICQQDYATRID